MRGGAIRVAMVTGTYRPQQDGVAHYVQRLRAALAEIDVSTTVITTKEAARASADPTVRGASNGWGIPDLPGLVRTVKRAANEGANIVHVQHAAGTYGFKRAVFFLPPLLRAAGVRAPLVTTVHEYGWWEWEPRGVPKAAVETLKVWGQRRGLWDREDAFLLTGSDALLTTNLPAETAIRERLPHLAPRLRRSPLAANVDVAPVAREEARRELRSRHGWPPDAEVVAYFGFLHPVKGIENLLKAFGGVLQERPGARLVLIGGAESLALGDEADWYWNELKNLVAKLGLQDRVAMTGYVPDARASRLLSGADVGVLPFNGGVTLKSGSLLALLGHGLPVIVTRPEGLGEPDLADGELVKVVERRDPAGLSRTLCALLADPALRARLERAGRAYARNLSWPAMARTHREIYEKVLGSF